MHWNRLVKKFRLAWNTIRKCLLWNTRTHEIISITRCAWPRRNLKLSRRKTNCFSAWATLRNLNKCSKACSLIKILESLWCLLLRQRLFSKVFSRITRDYFKLKFSQINCWDLPLRKKSKSKHRTYNLHLKTQAVKKALISRLTKIKRCFSSVTWTSNQGFYVIWNLKPLSVISKKLMTTTIQHQKLRWV